MGSEASSNVNPLPVFSLISPENAEKGPARDSPQPCPLIVNRGADSQVLSQTQNCG